MEQEMKNTKEISLRDFWNVFIRCWWIVAVAAIIVAAAFKIYDRMTYIPYYKSTATLYILKDNAKNGETERTLSNTDFTLALNVVNDCDYLLKSHLVLDEVIEDLHLDISYGALKGSISTKNPENTRFLEVSVSNLSAKEAKKIVDKICDVSVEKCFDVMGLKQLNHCEYGNLNYAPYNVTGSSRYLLIAAVIALLIYAAFFLVYLFDNSISSDEEIENVLHLTVLGDIPDASASRRSNKKYKQYGKVGQEFDKTTNESTETDKEGLSE